MLKNLEEHRKNPKGNPSIERSKLDKGYAGRASTIQVTGSLDFGFENLAFPDRVYKVEKALYGLHQAPKAWFTKVKTTSTSMETQKPLLKDEDGEEVDVYMYRSMIGSLMYLTSSRPDIMFVVCAYAKY
nr:putative ribonuclease H-like domain-containing protein [Tanacetum cinerariifolium]